MHFYKKAGNREIDVVVKSSVYIAEFVLECLS
jgi:hypothetical protein